jgi:hypothetical protein
MADASDVETALADQAAATLYPLGTQNASVTGAVYRIYRGWPSDSALEADLALGNWHVSVTAVEGTDPDVPQFPANWVMTALVAPALTVSVSGGVVTFGGSAATGQLAGILIDDTAFSYRTQPGDTPASVAANLAVEINTVFFVSVTGASITIPSFTRLIARVEADQTAILPTRRQRQNFRLACWCADPASRDATASALDASLAQIFFLTLPDGSAGRLRYLRCENSDVFSTTPLYRRDLIYSVDYATTVVQAQPTMLLGINENDTTGIVTIS